MKFPSIRLEILSSLFLAACGSSGNAKTLGDGGDSGAGKDGAQDSVTIGFGDVGVDGHTTTQPGDSGVIYVDGDATVLIGFDGEVNAETSCANSTITAPIVPPLILFLLDRSGSMCNLPTDPDGNGVCYYPESVEGTGTNQYAGVQFSDTGFATTKYGQLRTALDTLMSTGGLPQDWQVAVSFFAGPGGVVSGDECATDFDYTTPTLSFDTVANVHPLLNCWTGLTDISDSSCASIPNGLMEVNYGYKKGVSYLAPAYPNGDTPMAAALDGSIAYMQSQSTNSSLVVVLVTDGQPNCDTNSESTNISDVADTAAGGYNGSPQVLTYTIGVPGADSSLADVATAGGGSNYTISAGSDYVSQLVSAFQQIGAQAMGCTFNVPVPSNNQIVDPNSVTVNLTVNGDTNSVSKDTSNAGGYWAYTNGGQQIQLYGGVCDSVKTDPTASVQILVACETVQQVEGGVVSCNTAGGACPCCLGYHCAANNVCAANIVVQ